MKRVDLRQVELLATGTSDEGRATYTLPPSSCALTVTTTLPSATSEMTIEKAWMLWSLGAYQKSKPVQDE